MADFNWQSFLGGLSKGLAQRQKEQRQSQQKMQQAKEMARFKAKFDTPPGHERAFLVDPTGKVKRVEFGAPGKVMRKKPTEAQKTFLPQVPIKPVKKWSPRRLSPSYAYMNTRTKEVVNNIETEADLQDLIKNREAYEREGVNVQSVLDYYYK